MPRIFSTWRINWKHSPTERTSYLHTGIDSWNITSKLQMNQSGSRILLKLKSSGQDFIDQVAVYVSQSHVATIVMIGQFLMIQTHQVHQRSVQVIH